MTLKDFLIQYRTEHDLSQRQFAAICGLSNSYISMLERERNPTTGEKIVPTLQAFEKLARGMGITLEDIFDTIEDTPVDLRFHPEGDAPEDERELIAALRRIPPEKRREALRYLKYLAASEDEA